MSYRKRALAFLAGLLLCFGGTAAPFGQVYADDEETSTASSEEQENTFKEGDFTYTVDGDGNAVVESWVSDAKEVVIPSEMGGHIVTEIATEAFLESRVYKVTIPASVNYISTDNPFASCVALEEIDVDPENKNYCSVDGILYTKDMKKLVHYPAAKSGDSFEVPDGIEEIGIAGISENGLKSISLPDSLSKIGRHSFSFDERLESIDMSGTSIEKVEVMAFVNCNVLTEVKFSPDTKEIALGAFYGCSKLEEVELPEGLETVGQSAFLGTAMKEVSVPDTVTSIGYSAFGYDENQNPIDGFTIIGAYNSAAYTYCKDKDEEYGYANDFDFKSFEVAQDEEEYSKLDIHSSGDYEYALENDEATITICVSMDSSITVPDEIDGHKVTAVRKGAFGSLEATEIIYPDTVKTIGENNFPVTLQKVTLPAALETIDGAEPFIDCAALQEINVSEGEGEGTYSSADGILYSKDKKTLIVYPRAKEDKKFTLPADTEEIAFSAFCGNTFIEEADLRSAKQIASYAFENCTALKKVRFSKSLESVGENVFFNCHALGSVRLYKELTDIGDYAFGFIYDSALQSQIEQGLVQETNPYSVLDGFKIYTDEDTTAYKYAQVYDIEVVTNTVDVGSNNVNQNFIYVIAGIAAAVVLAVAGIITGKSISRKKASKKPADNAKED